MIRYVLYNVCLFVKLFMKKLGYVLTYMVRFQLRMRYYRPIIKVLDKAGAKAVNYPAWLFDL